MRIEEPWIKVEKIDGKQIMKRKNKLIRVILKRNKQLKYYNQKYLSNLFDVNNTLFIKKLAKSIVRPIYSRLMYRVNNMIDEKLWNFKNENM